MRVHWVRRVRRPRKQPSWIAGGSLPLRAHIVCLFNIAGPRQSGKGRPILPRFNAHCLNNQPITVFGAGNQVQAFTHVVDLTKGLILAMEKGKVGEAYNLGNSRNRITILELARLVVRLMDSKSEIVFVDPKTIYGRLCAEASEKYPDATKAFKELDWIPRLDIDQIILDSVEEIQKRQVQACPI